MKKYYIYYPRNFANEFCVEIVKPEHEKEFAEFAERVENDINADLQRVSYREAQKYMAAARRGSWKNGGAVAANVKIFGEPEPWQA